MMRDSPGTENNHSGMPPPGFNRSMWMPDPSLVEAIAPPSAVHHFEIRAVSAIYFLLFLFGLCGNVSILTIISQICRSLRKMETAFIYVTALSIVDLIVILSMPLAISDMLLGHWIFGVYVCKLHWFMESAGKILSTFVLTAMAWDRYIGVCHPYSPHVRTPRVSLAIVSVLIAFAIGILAPLPYFADSTVVAKSAILPFNEHRFLQFVTVKCRLSAESMDKMTSIGYTWTIFILGLAIPAVLSLYFYSRILCKIGIHQFRSSANSRISMRRVALYTSAISIFYFACWIPYWTGILYIRFIRRPTTQDRLDENDEGFVYVMYVIHALPFVNSAFNWVFYALLNTQLRRTRRQVAEKQASYYSMGPTNTRPGLSRIDRDESLAMLNRNKYSAENVNSPNFRYRGADDES